MALKRRLAQLEKRANGQGHCVACRSTPRCFLMEADDAEGEANYQRWMDWHREHCTCRQPFFVRRIFLHRSRGTCDAEIDPATGPT